MVALLDSCSRRAVLGATTSILASTHLSSKNDVGKSSDLEETICKFTPKSFREAVSKSSCFLYRGESVTTGGSILSPEPDLLLPETYNDSDALKYFQCLEKRLDTKKVVARPSTGHIAVSDRSEASKWGTAVSVWPLGTTFSYVWPQNRKTFVPASCSNDKLVIDERLSDALVSGREVLFASSFDDDSTIRNLPPSIAGAANSAFLVLPESFNSMLQELISSRDFLL